MDLKAQKPVKAIQPSKPAHHHGMLVCPSHLHLSQVPSLKSLFMTYPTSVRDTRLRYYLILIDL